MKNFVKIIIIIAEKVLTGHEKDERTAVTRVVDLQNGVATFKTSDENLWEWDIEPGETFEMRSCYRVTFDTLGTSFLLDNAIINIERD